MISPGVFLNFFKIFIFQAVRVVKGQKIAQNENWELQPSCAMSQEQYGIWSWFMIHLCEMMIYPGVFLFFLKVSVFALLEGGGGGVGVKG